MYGREPPTLLLYQPGIAKVAAVDKQLKERDEFLADIRDRLLQAQTIMKQQQDQTRREVEFQVWLRLLQRAATGITAANPSKLGPKFYGPYQVTARIGSVSYRLQLPARARIHGVFYVSLLKRFEGAAPTDVVPLPELLHGKVVSTPDKIMKARLNRGAWEILVKWSGRSEAEATWEKVEEFKQRHPTVELADELFVGEGGNVIDSFLGKFYQRRRPN